MNNHMDNRQEKPPVHSGFFDLSSDHAGLPELCD